MIQHDLVQGSPEWKAHRRNFKNGSDAPAAQNKSKYTTRDQLIHRLATGIEEEIDEATQKRFDEGHIFEELARPLAEAIIGDDLSPVTGTNGDLGSSFDGLTFNRKIGFEHKMLNNDIRACESIDDLDEMYLIQMEQGCAVADAEKFLFMATNWQVSDVKTDHFIELENGGIQYYKLIEQKHFWYLPNAERRQQIIDAWALIDQDVAKYVPVEKVVKPQAVAILALPSVTIQVKGELTMCNLAEVTPKYDQFLEASTDLKTDEDFANGKARGKFSRDVAKKLAADAQAVTDQIMPVGEAVRLLMQYAEKFNKYALVLEKQVEAAEAKVKSDQVLRGRTEYANHIAALEAEIDPIRLKVDAPEFVAAIKGVRTTESLINKINSCLANGKIAADAVARDIRAKQAWFKENHKEHEILFPDMQAVIYKPFDDMKIIVNARVDQFKAQEKAKEEKRIADEAKAKSEEAARAAATVQAVNQAQQASVSHSVKPAAISANPFQGQAHQSSHTTITRFNPQDKALDIIELVAGEFNCTLAEAKQMLRAINFTDVVLTESQAA